MFGNSSGTVKYLALLDGSVSSTSGDYVGGVVGYNTGTVENCHSDVEIDGVGNSVGGVVGWNYQDAIVKNCYATGNVNSTGLGNPATGSDVGGVVGYNPPNNGLVENCYATGNVSGYMAVGGVVGFCGSTLKNCVALNGNVTASASERGRVTGNKYMGTLMNNYARNDLSPTGSPGADDNIDGADVAASSYNTQSWWETTMAWDFTNTWAWDAANNLPILKWQTGVTGFAMARARSIRPDTFHITVTATEGGQVLFDGEIWNTTQSAEFDAGESIALKAEPSKGYAFVEWRDENGENISADAEHVLDVSADATLLAVFAQSDSGEPESGEFEPDMPENAGDESDGEEHDVNEENPTSTDQAEILDDTEPDGNPPAQSGSEQNPSALPPDTTVKMLRKKKFPILPLVTTKPKMLRKPESA